MIRFYSDQLNGLKICVTALDRCVFCALGDLDGDVTGHSGWCRASQSVCVETDTYCLSVAKSHSGCLSEAITRYPDIITALQWSSGWDKAGNLKAVCKVIEIDKSSRQFIGAVVIFDNDIHRTSNARRGFDIERSAFVICLTHSSDIRYETDQTFRDETTPMQFDLSAAKSWTDGRDDPSMTRSS